MLMSCVRPQVSTMRSVPLVYASTLVDTCECFQPSSTALTRTSARYFEIAVMGAACVVFDISVPSVSAGWLPALPFQYTV
jgi:hypothetical protein